MTEPKKEPIYKVGTFSNAESTFIKDSYDKASPEDIAARLNRSPAAIRRFLERHHLKEFRRNKDEGKRMVGEDAPQERTLRLDLRGSEKWRRLKQEYDQDELRLFEECYVDLMGQFEGDVLPSEETQIFDHIRLEILKSRNMVGRKRARAEIMRIEKALDKLTETHGDDPSEYEDNTRESWEQLKVELKEAKSEERAHTAEYVKFQERQGDLAKSLKSTRDQRVRDVTSGKETFLGLIKKLQKKEVRAYEGREAELVRMAAVSQSKRLGNLHTYEDGQVDRPILSADTVDQTEWSEDDLASLHETETENEETGNEGPFEEDVE